MTAAIEIHRLGKHYGALQALAGVDLHIPQGEFFGLLGPNGAGKSTTMKLLTAQALPDEGEIEILGLKVPEQSKAARALCGVVPQLDNLDVTLTVEQNLLVFAHLYRVPRADRRAAVERALQIANLTERRDKAAGRARVASSTVDTSKVELLEAEQQALADAALGEFAAAYGIEMPAAEKAEDAAPAAPPAREMGPEKQS